MDSTLFVQIVSMMTLIGIPSIFATTMWCIKTCQKYTKQLKILMNAQQAQMRSQLLKDYYEYKNRGYVLDVELKEWENQYNAYHALGANGVLDKRYNELLSMPSQPTIPTNN